MRKKSKIRLLGFAILTAFLFTGCKEKIISTWEEANPPFTVTETQIMQLAEEALTYSSLGLQYELIKLTSISAPILLDSQTYPFCEAKFDSTLIQAPNQDLMGGSGRFIGTVHCDSTQHPQSMDINTNIDTEYSFGEGGFQGVDGRGDWLIKKVPSDESAISISGHYGRHGGWRNGTYNGFTYSLSFDLRPVFMNSSDLLMKNEVTTGFNFSAEKWSPFDNGARFFKQGTISLFEDGTALITVGAISRSVDIKK